MIGIAEATERWQLADVRQIADTPGSHVFRARRANGAPVIVKLLKPRGMGEISGMDYLEWRDGHGAITLLARHANACLLQDAGLKTLEDLRAVEGEEEATRVFAAVLRALHAPSPNKAPPRLVRLERHFAALVEKRPPAMAPEQAENVAWAAATARDLLATQTDVMPLHGDLHHENILADETGTWRAIDPHGLIGDPVYDAANFFGNPIGRPDITGDEDRIRLVARMVAPALGCDEAKVLRYAAAHAALSACWSMSDPVAEDDIRDADHRLALLAVVRRMLG
jgi:streptomycin 6-kinase